MAKVRPGQDFTPVADDWNSFVDAADYAKRQLGSKSNNRPAAGKNLTVVRVYNDSGSNLNRFEAVGITDIAQEPSSSINDPETMVFFNTVLKVKKPADADKSRWLVLINDIPDGEFGLAVAYGVVPCRINIANTSDLKVEIEDGNSIPQSGDEGFNICWVKGGVGAATTTGEQWAVIMLGGGGSAKLPKGEFQGDIPQMVADNELGFGPLVAQQPIENP